MKNFRVILLFLNILKVCLSLEHVWHSYQYDPIHKSREEIVITNITSDDTFKLNYVVTRWKSLCLEKICHLAGLMDRNVVITSVNLDTDRKSFSEESSVINLDAKPIEVVLFQYWNTTSEEVDAMVVIATQKSELLWYRISDSKNMFWSWYINKNISHISIFQIEYDYHLLIINQHLSHITADLYEFIIFESPNFWLRQKLDLLDSASSSAIISTGPDYFLAIPQKSINSLLIYKFITDHFTSYKNLTSRGVDKAVAFKSGQKSFLAFNGLNASIYRFGKKDLVREDISGSHTDGVNYWLPILLNVYGDDSILIAQRSLKHEPHRSFVIEVITYNGDKFEEHEDIPCLYFGEEMGLSCLPDEEEGMEGAVAITLDDALGLLVPRKNRSSELFLVKTDLIKISNPLVKQIEEFLDRRKNIDDLLSVQEERYNKFLARSRELDYTAIKTQLDEIEEDIKIIKAEVDSFEENPARYQTAVFNGLVKIINSGKFDQVHIGKINNEPADELLRDVVLRNNVRDIRGPKSFTKLKIEALEVEEINEFNSTDLIYAGSNVTIKWNWFLTKPLSVFGDVKVSEVNGLVFEEEIIDSESSAEDLVFENLFISGKASAEKFNDHILLKNDNFGSPKSSKESFFIPHHLEVVNINGESFDKFLTELCLKNIKNYILGDIRINGDVTILGNVTTALLNGLKFPSEFVFAGDEFSVLTGVKNFSKSLEASELNCEETVDDVIPSQIITLKTNQTISGKTTFKNLKITESLNVDGNITGEHASKFLPNPNLFETSYIKSKVHFKKLEIDGAIVITENFNGENLESRLSDIVYINENQSVIEAMKQFPEGFNVRKNLFVSSNSVNDINLNSIITKDTEQNLNLSSIKGVVTFDNIEVDGYYNTVDVKKLDEEVVKLDGEQYVSSTLIFEDEIDVNRLEVVEAGENLNMTTNQESIDSENIIVEGNIYGNINQLDLKKFDRSRMSFTKNQTVEGDFFINKALVKNMYSFELKKFGNKSCQEKLIRKVKKGEVKVQNLFVKESVEVDKIDDNIVMNLGGSFWKHDVRKHKLSNLSFMDDVVFNNIEIEKLSGVHFNKYVENIVFKDETDVRISGQKTFADGLTVRKLIETEKLNNVALSDILTKHGQQEILGPVTIHGDVIFEDNVTVLENFGPVPMKTLLEMYQEKDRFYIKGDVLFNRLEHIQNLHIEGYVDDRAVQEMMDGIIYKDEDFELEGLTTFDNNINFEKNIRVRGKINSVDLPAFVSDMVMITKDTDIVSPVTFLEEVVVDDQIVLHKELKTGDLNGVNLQSWMDNAVFINKGYLPGEFLFEDAQVVDSLRTDYINNINTSTLIPLRSQQNLPELSFSEVSVFKDVSVGNSTNYRNLPNELANTVLTNSEQDIDSNVEFLGNVFIEGDLQLLGSLNEMEPNRIVTTNSDQELNAIYNFKSKINLDNMTVEGFINGINVGEWANESVRISAQYPQNISHNWRIEEELIFEEDCSGNGLINGIDFRKFGTEIERKKNLKYQVEKNFIADYRNICQDLTYMYDKLKRQIYKFDYLENLQTLNFHQKIEYVHSYEHENIIYMIVNERKNCDSHLFIFDSRFRYMKSIRFGHVAQIISVHYNDIMYFVVRNQPFYSSCKVQGTNLWQLTDNSFVIQEKIKEQDVLQESLKPGTFYGIRDHTVTEFKITSELDTKIRKHRKWEVKEDNLAFVPRGLATGLAVRSGKKLIKLYQHDDKIDDYSYEIENIIVGNCSEGISTHFPSGKDTNLVVMKVGVKTDKRSLLAVASHEEMSVKGSLDFIKIYEDVITGKVFHKVATYNPSSLLSLEFNNGETLLAFLEDKSILQVYEYKGIEGFKHKLSAKLEGSKLFTMDLKLKGNKSKVMGVIDKNKISFMEVVMLGNQVEGSLDCSL